MLLLIYCFWEELISLEVRSFGTIQFSGLVIFSHDFWRNFAWSQKNPVLMIIFDSIRSCFHSVNHVSRFRKKEVFYGTLKTTDLIGHYIGGGNPTAHTMSILPLMLPVPDGSNTLPWKGKYTYFQVLICRNKLLYFSTFRVVDPEAGKYACFSIQT